MATKTNMQIGEDAWLRLTQSQQLELFKELIMERIELGDLLLLANKSLDQLRTDIDGTADLVDQQRKVIDGQGLELDRMQRLLGERVGH